MKNYTLLKIEKNEIVDSFRNSVSYKITASTEKKQTEISEDNNSVSLEISHDSLRELAQIMARMIV
ncbi:MAG: hypothetical protein IPM95_07075 [Sphingobacteriales bacterium]|jgi:hypothetical protein|nr:hypothetical protein [Sphingobacteriales bacterium]